MPYEPPHWMQYAIRETDQQFAEMHPSAASLNARLNRDPEARRAAVSAAVATHTQQTDADGMAALEAFQKADAAREAARIARLTPPS